MSWMQRMILGGLILRAPEGDGGGGGGGGSGDGKGGSGDGKGGEGKPSPEVEALRTQNADLLKRLEALEAKGKPKPEDDDLLEKEKKARAEKDRKNSDAKAIEAALKFSLGAKDWVKTNSSLLPKEVEGIFAAAEKETYDSAIEKDQAIKSSLITAFFQQQANLDLLTPSQKTALEDFQKLTKNGKQEKAQHIYDSIFEPTFEMLKRIKKAEQLRRTGETEGTDADQAYRDRMIKLSKKHYLGERENA